MEIGGLEPSAPSRPSIAEALRTFATAFSQLAEALDQPGIGDIGRLLGPILGAPPKNSNGHQHNGNSMGQECDVQA